MTVASVMTDSPACCTPKATLAEVAQMMVAHDCGQIPVFENMATRKLAGVITDRDITPRIVAKRINASEALACDCMTYPCITVKPEDSIESCCNLMETNKIRRVPVVNVNDAPNTSPVTLTAISEDSGDRLITQDERVGALRWHHDVPRGLQRALRAVPPFLVLTFRHDAAFEDGVELVEAHLVAAAFQCFLDDGRGLVLRHL